MKVAICQPTYLPWLGYFDLIDQVDVFILLDDVQFEKQSWQRQSYQDAGRAAVADRTSDFPGPLGEAIKDVEIRSPDFCGTIAGHRA